MPYFRRKSTIFEAHQYLADQPLPNGIQFSDEEKVAFVTTSQGQKIVVMLGEWIITEHEGRGYHPVQNEKFQQLYEYTEEV